LEFGAGEESRTLDLNLGKVALYQLSYSRMYYSLLLALHESIASFYNRCLTLKTKGSFVSFLSESGAGEESRTLDLNLGKVALYQLSYSRVNDRHAL
jgi:hypothetical protein